jgi:hypothetical protein
MLARLDNLLRSSLLLAMLACAVFASEPALAGCGCTKPPPPLASVRPSVAWSGAEVTLFDAALVAGQFYEIRFDSGTANGPPRRVTGTAVSKRDLSDGVYKPQVVVPLPAMPLGPASVQIRTAGGAVIADLADDVFTVAPSPIGIPTGVGVYRFENYRAAVGRDGTVYLALDFGDVQHARVFDAQAVGVPLRFESRDLAFWNVQGFLMQLLGQNMPGLFAIDASQGANSDVLRYSRHEFNTWFLQHGERESHAVDPSDAAWHLDGTHHIDHDHQILAIDAKLPGGSPLPSGPTPRFTLEVTTSTLFSSGVVGRDSVLVDNGASIQSVDLATGTVGHRGHVASNGGVSVQNESIVDGDATADWFDVGSGGVATGALEPIATPLDFLPVEVPSGLTDLGDLVVEAPFSLGVGSYRASKLDVMAGGVLSIENAAGPVTIYVTGSMTVKDGGHIETALADPESFAVYLVAGSSAKFTDESGFFGVVYGPDAVVEVDNEGAFTGAFVGASMVVKNGARVLYDASLHLDSCPAVPAQMSAPPDLVLVPGERISLPLEAGVVASGHELRIDGHPVPLAANVSGGVDFVVPANLVPRSEVEVTLVDSNGCRSRRTLIVPVKRTSAACGLLGVELAIVGPLLRHAVRRRRAS